MSEFEWPEGTLLGGIVGSTAYGMSRAGSDVDRLGVRAASWLELSGLSPPLGKRESSWISKAPDPDAAVHEALKFCHLALSCNPTVLELMWLPEDLYEVRRPSGNELIEVRDAFLSREAVRASYLGYARQQFDRLVNRGDGSFSSDTRKRTQKHARHLLRLLRQGVALYRTGDLTIRFAEPERLFALGEQIAGGAYELAQAELDAAALLLAAAESPLPERPDQERVEAWLRRTRVWAWRAPV